MDGLEKPSAPNIPETKDISRRSIMVLVLLTVVISLIGSFLVLNQISSSNIVVREERSDFGTVNLRIEYPSDQSPASVETRSTGFVALQIMENPEAKEKARPIVQENRENQYYYYGGE